jgi:hypothetical protein
MINVKVEITNFLNDTESAYEKERSLHCEHGLWVLPFLKMRCNIFETIYFNPSPYPSPFACLLRPRSGPGPVGRWEREKDEMEGRSYEQG